MKVLVTGGGGFLGFEIIRQLIASGHEVISVSRSHYDKLDDLNVKQIQCDITKVNHIQKIPKDIEAIFHVAAKAGIWGDYDEYYQINYLGTKNLVDFCKAYKIQNFVYTSTPSVAYATESLEGVDENIDYPQEYLTHYAKTKSMAEKYVLTSSSAEFKSCALRPHLIWGQGDPHILPRLVKKAKTRRLRRIGNGANQVDIIHVKNAAHAHLLALDNIDKANGKAYFLGQENPVYLWDFINKMLATQNIKKINKSISVKLAYKIGYFFELIYGILKIKNEPPMTRFVALQLGTSHYFSHKRAQADLGYRPIVTIEKGLNELTKV